MCWLEFLSTSLALNARGRKDPLRPPTQCEPHSITSTPNSLISTTLGHIRSITASSFPHATASSCASYSKTPMAWPRDSCLSVAHFHSLCLKPNMCPAQSTDYSPKPLRERRQRLALTLFMVSLSPKKSSPTQISF